MPIRKPRYRYLIAGNRREHEEIIALRTAIYQDAGKHAASHAMTDRFDQHAYLIGVWLDNELVASARVICQDPDAEWEHDRFVSWGPSLPPREDCCEISRFCVKKEHRNWRTIRSLCHGLLEAMLRSRRRYFIACCTVELVNFYRKFLGADFVGVQFRHDDLGDKVHHLFKCDGWSILVGEGMSFPTWAGLWPTAHLKAKARFRHQLPKRSAKTQLKHFLGVVTEPVFASLISRSRGD